MNGTFHSANASSSYNFPEIWPFPVNDGGESGRSLDLMKVQFGQSLGQFADGTNSIREITGNEPMAMDLRETHSGGTRNRRDGAPEDKSAKVISTSSGKFMNGCDGKRFKSLEDDGDSKREAEEPLEQCTKSAEAPKKDYIHVRARRGQATDSHSLAERARREKISERMKILQDLVPGCSKVIGKALVLDEIINYIQSLQNQVEFLSMKLEAVNSRISPNVEGFRSKDFGQQTLDTAGGAFDSQSTRDYGRSSSPQWLHMQIGGSFERTT